MSEEDDGWKDYLWDYSYGERIRVLKTGYFDVSNNAWKECNSTVAKSKVCYCFRDEIVQFVSWDDGARRTASVVAVEVSGRVSPMFGALPVEWTEPVNRENHYKQNSTMARVDAVLDEL